MKEFTTYFNSKDWHVTGFFPYTSSVRDRILTQSHNYKTEEHDFLHYLWEDSWTKAIVNDVKFDNKIVLQLTKKNQEFPDSVLYLGKYDGLISLGLSYSQDGWLKDR